MISHKEKHRRELVTGRLQLSLPVILDIGGWSERQFAETLGITKQSVSNWVNAKTKLTYLQYIAIRTVLDREIEMHPEKTALAQTIHLLLDADLTVTDDDYSKRLETAEIVAAKANRGLSDKDLSEAFRRFVPIICGIAAPPVGIAMAGAYWLLNSEKNGEKEGEQTEGIHEAI